MTKIEREDFVKQDFPVSDDRVGRFVFDTSLQTVKLYVLDSYEDYTSECAYLLLTAIDWTYFYNQIWRGFNFGDKIRYIFQWDAVTQGMRYQTLGNLVSQNLHVQSSSHVFVRFNRTSWRCYRHSSCFRSGGGCCNDVENLI